MQINESYENFVSKMEKSYPEMFSQSYGGFAIGKGWWPLVEILCRNIDSHVKWKNNLAEKYPDQYKPCPNVVVTQIKEKFGGLRFYYDGGDEYISGLVSMAESIAESTCENCGNPGIRRNGGWLRTLCDKHEEEYQKGKNYGN